MTTQIREGDRKSTRLELLFHVGRELSSRLELTDLLRRILVLTTESLEAPSGSILALAADGNIMDAALIYNGQVHDNAVTQLTGTLENGLAGWVIRNAQSALIPDTTLDTRWVKRDDGAESRIAKSAIGVPLQTRSGVVGALTLVHNTPGRFDAEDLSLATAIADQAAVAVENARLFGALRRQTQELAALYDTGLATGSVLEAGALLERFHQRVQQLINPDTFAVVFYDDERNDLELAMAVEHGEWLRDAVGLRLPVSEGLTGWVIRNRQPLLIGDLQTDPSPGPPRHLTQPARAWLGVPLIARDRIVGAVSVQSFSPHVFNEADRRFLESMAAQVAIALENARLFEVEQRRRQFASTLQEVARIINASLDPNQVFPLVLDQLARIIHFDSGSIMLREGDRLKLVAARGFDDMNAVLDLSVSVEDGGVSARVFRERRALVVHDVQAEPDWVNAEISESELIRGWIGAPLVVKDEVVGLITVDSRRAGAYAEADARLVSAFADQVATAVVNARLFAESQRQMHAMTALAETARAVTSTLDLSEVLRRLLHRTVSMLNVEAASIALVDETRGTLQFKVAEGKGAKEVTGLTLKLGQGIAGWVAQNGRPVLVPEARGDPRFYPDVDKQTGFTTRSIACVPIVIKDQVLGIIEVLNPQGGPFDRDGLQLLGNLAALAGSAIAHAQLFQETQAAELRYAGLFEDSIDPIIITDTEGTITEANRKACKVLGYERGQIIGLKIDAVHKMGTGLLGVERFRNVQSGVEMSFETKAMARGGAEMPVEVHAKRIVRGGQEFIQWIEHDISERQALDDMRDDLTSMIFHDLRSPLGNIISSLDVLKTALPLEDEALQSVLSIAARSSQRLSRLVDSLLDLRRLEAGQAILNREPASLTALVAEAAEAIHPVAESKGIDICFDLPAPLPPVQVDSDMLRRVIINLIENGVKYTPGPGTITVRVRTTPREATVSIQDTGPGIPESEHQRIFQRFARVQRQGGPKGLGLGLAFCKMAIEAHGGRIWVESQPGQGATFNFTLPL